MKDGAILARMATGKSKVSTLTFAEAFGARLREIRERRGMTQQQLADALKIHRPRITQYETGVVVPEGETLAAIAAVLEVSLDELILGRPSEQPDDVRDARLRASVRELEELRNRKLVDVVVTVVDALVSQEHVAAVQARVTKRQKK